MMAALLAGTCVVVLISMAIAYARSRDPLHPLMFVGPMMLYVYVARPARLYANGQLEEWIPEADHLIFAQSLFGAGIALFCLGALWGSRGRQLRNVGSLKFDVPERVRQRMFRLGCVFGTVSIAAYSFAVMRSGGFVEVYSRSKARISAGSGWINELVNLSIPAVAFLVLSWQGQRRHRGQLLLALVSASPLLLHGLLGARRGPTFMILSALLVSWYLASRKRVSVFKVMTRFGLIAVLAMFLVSHRQDIHLGSELEFDLAKLLENIAPSTVDESDDTVFHYGFVNGIREWDQYLWGVRYFATYVVRPIPRQIWPTKYDDLGLGWMVRQSDFAGLTEDQWKEALGWTPVRGSAAGFTADLFFEFSYFGLIGCLALGWFFGAMWRRAHIHRGLAVLLYIQVAALSVYVPTQSVSAVFHRFLFMLLFTGLLWRFVINPERLNLANKNGNRTLSWRYILIRPTEHSQTHSGPN